MTRDLEVKVLCASRPQQALAKRKVTSREAVAGRSVEQTRESTDRNRIQGVVCQRARDREAVAVKEPLCRSGGCAGKVTESYLGRSRPMPERRSAEKRSEKSAEAVVASRRGQGLESRAGKGPNGRESETAVSPNDARRQKPEQLGLPLEGRGEAPRVQRSGEAPTLTSGEVRSGSDQLMEQVVARGNVRVALARVRENRGRPGVDGMTVEELPQYLMEHWEEVREQLLGGTYQPKPVLRREIPKRDGGVRELVIPCVLDRLIQQAILQVLQPRFDPSFSQHSYGFRPGRSAHDAVLRAQRYVEEGRRWGVDVDLEKFLDRVNHDVLMGRLVRRVSDTRLVRLIRRYLNAGVMANGVVMERDEGTPQGGPLTPLTQKVIFSLNGL